jgi:outer membrane protein OmpA-like peptidoglycan-associated protein
MNAGIFSGTLVGVGLLAASLFGVRDRVDAAHARLERGLTVAPDPARQVAVADDAEAPYCTPQFKEVLQRVLFACGLVGGDRRGCQPADVEKLATLEDDDFNALFTPLEDRGGVILFDESKDELDDSARKLLEKVWSDRRGARYFFIVARASKTGTRQFNQQLSHKRANSVKFFLEDTFKEPDLDKKVGMMWLGYDYAQLGKEYCRWSISRPAASCDPMAVNRSVFVSWVDCRL